MSWIGDSSSEGYWLTPYRINDNVMEMLIMINACKGGSARTITGA